jgi:hypothetical protein
VDPVGELGRFDDALPSSDWDFLVVQPFPGEGSTLTTDIEVIQDLAQMVSQDTTVLVFTGWPSLQNFEESWDSTSDITDDSPTVHSRAYFDTLIQRLDDLIDQDVELIPTGEVLSRMQPRLASGDVPGLESVADLYADDVHLSELGSWLSGVTAASVITGVDPFVFGKPSSPWYGDNTGFSKEYIQTVREVVAEVLAR